MKYDLTKSIKTAGIVLEYSRGGLHYGAQGDFIANKEFLISDFDVSSLYPSLMLEYGLKPRHQPDGFLPLFRSMVEQRLAAKASGDKATADALKLCINSLYGLTGNATADRSYVGPFFDPACMLAVCLHGQLLISKLLDEYLAERVQVIQVNTDGIQIRYPAHARARILAINDEWQHATKLVLEETQIKRNFACDVNNYIAITEEDKVKAKGRFATGSGNRAAVVGLACQEHVKSGVDIATFVRNTTDPRAFLMPLAIKHPFHAELGGERVGNVARYYHTKRGLPLFKRDATRRLAVGGFDRVAICSKLEHVLPKDLDIEAYIQEAEELLGNKQQELNLF